MLDGASLYKARGEQEGLAGAGQHWKVCRCHVELISLLSGGLGNTFLCTQSSSLALVT